MANEIEDLIVSASSGDDAAVRKLKEASAKAEVAALREQQANFDLLFDEWDKDEETTPGRAAFILSLAERDALDSVSFRNQLNEVVSFLLPPYIASQAVQKAVGARDNSIQTHEVALRLKKLQRLRNGALICQPEARTWGKIASIERVTATISINSLRSGSLSSMPVSSVFSGCFFFEPHKDIFDLLSPTLSTLKPAAEYKRAFMTHSLPELSEAKIQEVIRSVVVPDCLSADQFEVWWLAAGQQTPAKTGKRSVWDARSVLELYMLINPEEEGGKDKKKADKAGKVHEPIVLPEEGAEKLAALFARLRPGMDGKSVAMLADSIAVLSAANPPEMLLKMFSSLKGRVPFWPQTVKNMAISPELEIWGHVSIRMLNSFIKATSCLYTAEELAAFGCVLPLRSLTVFFDSLPIAEIAKAVFEAKELSCDILLYLWKNRSKLPVNLTQIVDMDHIAKALTREHLPKEWASAQRDLKRTLFEKEDFQKFVLGNADGDMPSIIDALQRVRTFQFGECQSLLVKLSKHSDELRERLERGEGNALVAKTHQKAQPADVPLSSLHSVSRLAKELDHIVNVQIPENVAAIKHARSYGDLSENAEYDAAKQERRNLHSRRSKLESILGSVLTANFDSIEVSDIAVMGSTVTLKGAGKNVVYHLVGAYDGDPDAFMIAYQAPIGKAIVGHKVGEKVTLPDGSSYTIEKVAPLPAEMIELFGKEV